MNNRKRKSDNLNYNFYLDNTIKKTKVNALNQQTPFQFGSQILNPPNNNIYNPVFQAANSIPIQTNTNNNQDLHKSLTELQNLVEKMMIQIKYQTHKITDLEKQIHSHNKNPENTKYMKEVVEDNDMECSVDMNVSDDVSDNVSDNISYNISDNISENKNEVSKNKFVEYSYIS